MSYGDKSYGDKSTTRGPRIVIGAILAVAVLAAVAYYAISEGLIVL